LSNSELTIPADVQEALLDWHIMADESGDEYWSADRWEAIRYSAFLKILFLRNTDPDWLRKNHSEREGELDDWLRKKTGRKRLIVGYFTPRRAKAPPG
jgi:hypothetical protein